MDNLVREEEQKLLRRMRLEQLTRERRLLNVEEAERGTTQLMKQNQVLREMELIRFEKECALRKQKDQWDIESRLQEEALKGLEFRANQKTAQLSVEQASEAHARNIRVQGDLRDQTALLEDRLTHAEQREGHGSMQSANRMIHNEIKTRECIESLQEEDKKYLQSKEEI